MSVRRWLWNAHQWFGLACVLFLLVQALSGMLMVLQDRLNLIEAVGGHAPTSELGGIDRALQTLSTRDSRYAPAIVTPPPKASHSWQVYMSPTQEFGPRRLASIDASSGEVLTERRYTETSMGWLLQLHTELFVGAAGRWLIFAVGIALAILAVLGFVILRNRWRTLLSNPLAGSMRWRMLHRWSGIAGVTFLLLWALSGLLLQWSMLVSSDHAVASSHAVTPVVSQVALSELLASPPVVKSGQVLAIALPTTDAPQIVFTMVDRAALPWSKFTVLTFDPVSGRQLGSITSVDMPAWERVMATARALHMGIFEVPMVQVIYVLLAALVVLAATTGPVTWLRAQLQRR